MKTITLLIAGIGLGLLIAVGVLIWNLIKIWDAT